MPLSHRRLDAVTEADLQGLITTAVREGRRIEYKRQLPGASDEEKREFLADVSSFANASGGDLIYGVEEDGGLPTALPGVQADDVDAEILRMESMIRSGIEPRLPGLHLAVVTVDGAAVIIVRIPQSWALPHVVTFRNYSRFFSRTSAGKYQLDVSELRALFARSGDAAERIRRFRDERLARIVADEGAFPTPGPARIVLHVVPARLFDPGFRLDLTDIEQASQRLAPINHYGFSWRFNLDGFATFVATDGPIISYVQLFRSGAIEAVETRMLQSLGQDSMIPSARFVRELITSLPLYLSALRGRAVDLPVAVLITLLGVRGSRLAVRSLWNDSGGPIDRDTVQLPEVIIEDWETPIGSALRPAFDALWNAAGWAQCSFYGPDGELRLPQ